MPDTDCLIVIKPRHVDLLHVEDSAHKYPHVLIAWGKVVLTFYLPRIQICLVYDVLNHLAGEHLEKKLMGLWDIFRLQMLELG